MKDAETVVKRNPASHYSSFKGRAEKANITLINNQARVQLNRQQLMGKNIDYLTIFKKQRELDNIKKHQEIDWSTYAATSMAN